MSGSTYMNRSTDLSATNVTTVDKMEKTSSGYLISNERLSLYIILFFVGTISNTLLITIVLRRKTQKNVYEMLVLNLAVSDLLLLLLHIIPNVHAMVSDFKATTFYCSFLWPMNTVVFLLAIFTITTTALHRYWLIVHPYAPKPTRRAAALWITGMWLGAFLITLPLMIIAKEGLGTNCVEDWPTHDYRRAYTVVLLLFEYAIPLVLIATAYVRIALTLTRSRVPCDSFDRTYQKKRRDRKNRKENLQVVKTLAAIVILFSFGMLPIQLAWMIKDFGAARLISSAALEMLFIVGDLALCFHATIDPLIYGVFVKQFRREYLLFLHKGLSCCLDVRAPDGQPNSSLCNTPLRSDKIPSKSQGTITRIRET